MEFSIVAGGARKGKKKTVVNKIPITLTVKAGGATTATGGKKRKPKKKTTTKKKTTKRR